MKLEPSKKNKLIGLVTPWFGPTLKGGAEQQAWQIATRLAKRGYQIEVLTTCCRSFFDNWAENHLPAGTNFEAGLTIRRFLVDERDQISFDKLNCELLEQTLDSFRFGVSPVPHERATIWTQQNINSKALEDYLTQYKDNYKAFIFLPYLYGVILRGLPLVADRAWLQPCLHNESYAYLADVASVFQKAHGLLFISAGEMQLAARLYGPVIYAKGEVAGAGIELDTLTSNHMSDLPSVLASQRFLLCLGRRDIGKGVDRLIAAFRSFHQSQHSTNLRLVLAGPGEKSYTDSAHGIIDLGLVSEAEKAALLQSCLILCQPSTNESFSRVLFEAWICGKPTLVHRDCLATATAVEIAKGGWTAGDEEEWVAQINRIDRYTSEELSIIGMKGRRYAEEMANWDKVIVRYETLLELKEENRLPPILARKTKSIHQLLPNLSHGDAISNQALQIQKWLRESDYHSEIFVCFIDPTLRDQCQSYKSGAISSDDILLYHHSIGSEVTSFAAAHPGPKCLIYHNITPAEFFYPYRPEFSHLLRQGREELWTLASSFPISAGVSSYNAEELAMYGFNLPKTLPLSIDPNHWNTLPDENLMRQLQDGRHNILFVGRYAPNKCQHHLVEAFAHYLMYDPDARLILIGSGDSQDPYVQHLLQTIEHYNLKSHVIMPGHITETQLHAYYRTAHLFWSMSEHEGFCVPLIEAMWFDMPVLTFRSSAIPETMADAGLIFNEKRSLNLIAILARELIQNKDLRNSIISKQRLRRESFLPEKVVEQFFQLTNRLI